MLVAQTAAPPKAPSPRSAHVASGRAVSFGPIPQSTGDRIGIYGPGGIGKTLLAATAPGPVAFIDLEGSLSALDRIGDLAGLDLRIVSGVESFGDIRDCLCGPGWGDIRTVVVDTATKVQELDAAHVIANIPGDKGDKVQNIEGFGWGKGYRHLGDQFALLLQDLDRHQREGRNVILICHETKASVPNPEGIEEWLRYEPDLFENKQVSIRGMVRNWCDHLLAVTWDVYASGRDKRAAGGETRTIHPIQSITHMAKSRTLKGPIAYTKHDKTLWERMFSNA